MPHSLVTHVNAALLPGSWALFRALLGGIQSFALRFDSAKLIHHPFHAPDVPATGLQAQRRIRRSWTLICLST
eukprot:scaffold188887_cov18-Tisochrysis_lutea.AAC.1